MRLATIVLACVILAGCKVGDPNAKAIYGKETGLPVNCRAYVQTAIDGYRNKQWTADETFAGLERNCGLFGQAWGLTE